MRWIDRGLSGLLILGGVGVTVVLMMKKLTNNWKGALVKKYEERKAHQREQFGHDVAERAAEKKR